MAFPRRRSWQGDRQDPRPGVQRACSVPVCWALLWALVPEGERGVVPALKELVF